MLGLKQIVSRNIQNHKEVVIDFPPTGFIVFMGDNSNGKSVIIRATRDLLCNNIKKPQTRYDLVNKEAAFGEVIYTRSDGAILIMHLAREAATTYVSLQEVDSEPVIRYLADKNYMDLVRRFGWHVGDEIGRSLNISENDDALFFYKTPYRDNCKILQSATTDPIADRALANMKTTLADARKFRDNAVTNVRVIQSALNNLVVHDVEALKDRHMKLEYYYRNLSQVYFPKIPEIKAVPVVKIHHVHTPVLRTIRYPRIYNLSCKIPDILPLTREMQSLRDRKCPTCGRGFDCDC